MTEVAADRETRVRALLASRLAATAGGVPRRTNRSTPVPLSPAQRAMWLTWQVEPDSPAYNVPVVLRLRGRLDVAALSAAVDDVVARHEVLHAVVTADGAMSVRPATAGQLTSTVISGPADPAAAGQRLEAVAADAACLPFALDAEPPVRAQLWTVAGTDEHLALFTFHHLAMDAWSIRIFLDELAGAYAIRAAGSTPPAGPDLPQYGDFVVWQGARRPDADLDWWGERLAGLPPALDLPIDRPREATTGWAATQVPVVLDAELTGRVRAWAAGHGSTPFMVLLAALQALLARICGATDIAIGVPEAGRHHADTERMLGSFVNTLIVRGEVRADQTGRQLLAEARRTALDAFAHARAPFAQLVEALAPARVPGVTPLFQVLFNVHDATPAPAGLAGLRVTLVEPQLPVAKFDLSWTIEDHGASGLRGVLVTRRELFSPTTARQLVTWYLGLLDGLLTRPDVPLHEVVLEPVTGPLLAGPPRTGHGPPVHVLIEQAADRCPDAVAVVGPDGSLRYRELDRAANRLAHRLISAGLGVGDTVGVLAERGTELVIALLAVLKAGAAYLPLDPAYPADRIAGMLTTAGAAAVLTQPELAGRVSGREPAADGPGGLAVLHIGDPGGPAPEHRPMVAVTSQDRVYVVFTSGSTGRPKGVEVEHGQLAGYLRGALDRMGAPAAAGASFALVSTIAADLGLTCVFGSLTTGGTLHVVDREMATDPMALAGYLAGHRVDVLKCVPSHLEMLAAHGDLAAVLPRRMLLLAGEPCPWDLVRRVRTARPELAVQNSYGPTETTVAVFMCDVDEVPVDRRDGTVPLGTPLPGVECHVVDATGRPLPPGIAGELWLGGPVVARGYVGRDDLTAERFVPDPITGTTRCYRTGDQVRVDRDGSVRFLGRLDDQVKVRGFRVELGEVAEALRAVPGVREAAVLPTGEAHNRRLLAWVAPEQVDLVSVRATLRDRLPDYMVPASLVALPALPLTPNGKVDRARLPVPEAGSGSGGRAAPSTPEEIRVAEVWRRILGVARIGVDDDFFALGGDSFQAVRAVRDIDAGIRVIDLFTYPTVRELGGLLARRASANGGAGELLHQLGGPPDGRAAELTIVCVPYGGGSAAAYRPLAQALGGRLRTLAVELPGHDPARPDEPLLPMADLVARLADEVLARVDGPLVVYGHCVGTATALALALALEERGRELAGVVLGGAFPTARLPGRLSALVSRVLPTDRMVSDRDYRDWLRLIGGMEDLDDAETERMMYSLRHDARQAEAWFTAELTTARPAKLRSPILCVVGERDRGTELYRERHLEWGAFTDRVDLATIPRAGHYFVKHQAAELAAIIDTRIGAWRAGDVPATVQRDVAVHGRSMRRSLRDFYTVALGQTVSLIGSAIGSFALGVWAYQRDGRMLDYALVTMLALLPTIAILPVGGAVADRYDRRRIMMICDAVSALNMTVLALALAQGRLGLWLVAVVAGIGSTITAFHRPAYLAAVAQLAPKPYLTQANALAQLGTGVGMLVAPLAGGALVVALGLPWVIGIDVASFSVGLLTLLLVRFPDRLFRRREETFRRALVGGWRYLTRRRPLMIMIAYFTVVNYLFTVALVVSTPMVLTIGDAGTLGLVTAASGLGAAAGSVVMLVWGGTRRRATGMVGFVIGLGVGVLLMGLRPSIPLICVGAVVWWASLSILNAHWISMIQLKVGLELQGRVLAMNQMMAVAMTPLAFVTAPVLADRFFTPLLMSEGPLANSIGRMVGVGAGRGVGLLLIACGIALVVLGVGGLRYRPLALMEDALPNAVNGPDIAEDLDAVQAEADRALHPAGR